MGVSKIRQPLLITEIVDNSNEVVKTLVKTLTAAQLAGMFAAPVSVVPAPGAGKVLIIDHIVFKMTTGATAFTAGGAVQFQMHTSPNAVVHQGTIPATTVTNSSGAGTIVYGFLPVASGSNALALVANDGIDITNATAGFSANGTGTASVYVRYRTLKL